MFENCLKIAAIFKQFRRTHTGRLSRFAEVLVKLKSTTANSEPMRYVMTRKGWRVKPESKKRDSKTTL